MILRMLRARQRIVVQPGSIRRSLEKRSQSWSRSARFFGDSSADGNYEVTLMTKATVYYSGLVVWQPPAVYKSSCSIDVEFFPYDVQTCVLKLGSWTYDGFKVPRNSNEHDRQDWTFLLVSYIYIYMIGLSQFIFLSFFYHFCFFFFFIYIYVRSMRMPP